MVNSSIVHVSGGGQFKASCSAQLTGFTLAEVLITLGIIGIVAALTIPGLVTNYFIVIVLSIMAMRSLVQVKILDQKIMNNIVQKHQQKRV